MSDRLWYEPEEAREALASWTKLTTAMGFPS